MSAKHHEWCGECRHVTTEYTPFGFPLPGEIAEELTRQNLKQPQLHRAIAEAIAARDKIWEDYYNEALFDAHCEIMEGR